MNTLPEIAPAPLGYKPPATDGYKIYKPPNFMDTVRIMHVNLQDIISRSAALKDKSIKLWKSQISENIGKCW